MNVTELQQAFRQLRLGGIASTLETRLPQAQAEPMAPVDLISVLISDELTRRADRLLERQRKVINVSTCSCQLYLQFSGSTCSGHRCASESNWRSRTVR
jgi:hypothetical protein